MTQEDANLSEFDTRFDAWALEVGLREQIEMLATITRDMAGERLNVKGGAEGKMLILRQKNLFERWVRQAYVEASVGYAEALSAAKEREQMLREALTEAVRILEQTRDDRRSKAHKCAIGATRAALAHPSQSQGDPK